MSLNVSGSKYVRVYDTQLKLQVSDKILFARLSTSRKTGNDRVDKETGEIITDAEGKPMPEHMFSSWNARFVGNAFEPGKGLAKGAAINILNGWIINEPYAKQDGSTGYASYVTITDFEVCDVAEGSDEEAGEESEQ